MYLRTVLLLLAKGIFVITDEQNFFTFRRLLFDSNDFMQNFKNDVKLQSKYLKTFYLSNFYNEITVKSKEI